MLMNVSAAPSIADENNKPRDGAAAPLPVECQCSLMRAREAIARWTRGAVKPVRPEGQRHISVQQRWLTQAQRDLTAWIGKGGFCQACEPAPAVSETGLLAPAMYALPTALPASSTRDQADACVE